MITIGALWRHRLVRPRRTPTYTRRTRRRRSARQQIVDRGPVVGDTEAVLFDRSSGELPCATVRSQSGMAGHIGDLERWLATRWSWLRPRMLPVVVALIGAVGLLESGRYLSDMAKGVNAPVTYHSHVDLSPTAVIDMRPADPVQLQPR